MSICKTPDTGSLTINVLSPKVWQSGLFARRWFDDAKHEAAEHGGDARRREIIFAVCFAESYLLEWVRDDVLKRQFDELKKYFAVDRDKREREKPEAVRPSGVIGKWKKIPKRLKKDNLIRECPARGASSVWTDFSKLVDYRDGLIHARASLPHHSTTPHTAMPEPTAETLQGTVAGWPTRVVVAIVRELHACIGTSAPPWLTDPQ